MISFNQARKTILNHCHPGPAMSCSLPDALDYYLIEDIHAPFDLPRFDNAAVDGFGVLCSDVQQANQEHPTRLQLIKTIQAGDPASPCNLTSGQSIKILTGAVVPPTIQAVVMKEDTLLKQNDLYVHRAVKSGDNIRRRGEEFRRGDRVLSAGTRISPPTIGLLATLGLSEVKIVRPPNVAVVSTGNELVQPGQAIELGQIYNSNSWSIQAALKAMGVTEVITRHSRDEGDHMKAILQQSLADSDVLITIGGVSVGDYDLVKETLADLGVELLFWQVAMKPGKPNLFGIDRRSRRNNDAGCLIFGLPGNPVSALVSCHQLIKPALSKMMGAADPSNPHSWAFLTTSLNKKKSRTEFFRAQASSTPQGWQVTPVKNQGSHMLGGLVDANCLIRLEETDQHLTPNTPVRIDWLDWAS